MLLVEATSIKDYLTGPRPVKLGVVTGRLRSSITSRAEWKGRKLLGIVGTNVFYGKFHEEGTERFPARPFLEPAFRDRERKIIEMINATIKETTEETLGQ
jgi:HK97 gp10 family phage protein